MRFFRFYCKRFRFYKFWTSLFSFLYYFRFVNEHRFRFRWVNYFRFRNRFRYWNITDNSTYTPHFIFLVSNEYNEFTYSVNIKPNVQWKTRFTCNFFSRVELRFPLCIVVFVDICSKSKPRIMNRLDTSTSTCLLEADNVHIVLCCDDTEKLSHGGWDLQYMQSWTNGLKVTPAGKVFIGTLTGVHVFIIHVDSVSWWDHSFPAGMDPKFPQVLNKEGVMNADAILLCTEPSTTDDDFQHAADVLLRLSPIQCT